MNRALYNVYLHSHARLYNVCMPLPEQPLRLFSPQKRLSNVVPPIRSVSDTRLQKHPIEVILGNGVSCSGIDRDGFREIGDDEFNWYVIHFSF